MLHHMDRTCCCVPCRVSAALDVYYVIELVTIFPSGSHSCCCCLVCVSFVGTKSDKDESQLLQDWILNCTVNNLRFMWAVNIGLFVLLLNSQASYGYLHMEHSLVAKKLMAEHGRPAGQQSMSETIWSQLHWGLLVVVVVKLLHRLAFQNIACLSKIRQERDDAVAILESMQTERDDALGQLSSLQDTHDTTSNELNTLRQQSEASTQVAVQQTSDMRQQWAALVDELNTLRRENETFQRESDRRESGWLSELETTRQELERVTGEARSLERIIEEQQRVAEQLRRATRTDCSVCIDRPVNTAVVPCGHTFCGHCTTALQARSTRHCPICRTPIGRVMRIHIG